MDTLSIGRLVIDFYPEERDKRLRDVRTFKKYCGGGPANFATGTARLGLKSGMISVVGNDEFGNSLIDFLRSETVDVSSIRLSKRIQTSLSFCGMVKAGNFPFMQYGEPGPNLELSREDIHPEYIARTKVLFLSGVGFSKSPSREASLYAMECARKSNVLNAFDVNFRKGFWRSKREVLIHHSSAIRLSNIVFGTFEEIKYVTGENDLRRALRNIFKQGPGIVCVKSGAKGSTIYTMENAFKIPAFGVKVFDTTGAGDSYDAGFIYGILRGWDHQESGVFASALAAIVVSREGAAPAMPRLDEVEAFIERNTKKKNGS